MVTAISRYPNTSNAQLTRIILESFSNVGTRTEASHYLKMIQLDNNDTLTAHNTEYEAVHTVAYGISKEEQNDEQILRAYANTLCYYAATKLNRKIIRRGSRIKTLKDAMEEAEILDSQFRQEKISQIERDPIRDTTISDSINDISLTDESVNFMQTRRSNGKFNNTMKNGHQNYFSGNKQSNYSNYNNSDNFSKNWSPQQNRINRRRLQRYRHQSRWPKHEIKFEYNSRDKNMMGNLRRTINYMKEGAQNREAARRLPKFVNRTIDEVSEDNIATISITEIQTILNEDIDLIFDALVIGDYIKDEEEV